MPRKPATLKTVAAASPLEREMLDAIAQMAATVTDETPGAPAAPVPASDKQLKYIITLLKQRDHQTCIPGRNSRPLDLSKVSAEYLTGGRNGTASELIGWLMRRPFKSAAVAAA